jgi:hypothetical protein
MEVTTFEIRMRTHGNIIRHLNWDNGVQYKKETKMYQIDARTREQAIKKARKHKGEIVSCRKVDATMSLESIEKLPLDNFNIFDAQNPYPNAIAMDEMIWKKRTTRRKNMQKDKEANY